MIDFEEIERWKESGLFSAEKHVIGPPAGEDIMKLPPLAEVREVIGFEEANKYLKKGWVLVSTHMAGERQAGLTTPTLLYVVGRPKEPEDMEERKKR